MHDRKIESWISKAFPPETSFLELVPLYIKNALIEFGESIEFEPGQVILRRGDIAERFFIVQNGTVLECGKKSQGKYTEQIPLPRGQSFGEHSILAGIPVTRTWVADTDVTLLTMPRDRFITFLIEYPGVMVVLYRLLAERLRRKEIAVDSLMKPGVQGNLSTQSFMDIAQSFMTSNKTGKVTLENGDKKAVIGFNDGQICWGKSKDGASGIDVLNDVVSWEEGKFSYENTAHFTDVNIQGDTMGLLLDALRQLDEASSESSSSEFELF